MSEQPSRRPSYARVVLGLAIAFFGLAFTLDNLHLARVDFHYLFSVYWPVVFIALGLASLVQARTWTAYGGSLVWLFVGGWLIAENLGLVSIELWAFWPVVFVLIGGYILFGGGNGVRERLRDSGIHVGISLPDRTSYERAARAISDAAANRAAKVVSGAGGGDRLVNALAVMSGVARKVGSQDFAGGDLIAVMGGCKIDLRDAEIASSRARLYVFAMWGGIEIIVPDRWGVDLHVLPLLGGADDRTVQPPAGAPRLVVRGMAIMGGVDVRNTPQ